MKKLLLLAFTAVMMAGCTERNSDGSIVLKDKFEHNGDYYIEVIDSCEYVCSSYRMTHKGNCRFCKERRQKEMQDIINKLKN